MNFEKGVIGVGLARKQGLDLKLRNLIAERAERRFRFGHDRLIALGLPQLDEAGIVGKRLFEAEHPPDAIIELLARPHQPLRLLWIVPEARVFDLPVQLGKLFLRRLEVKDASSAVRATA
jgi:hypothetical protein